MPSKLTAATVAEGEQSLAAQDKVMAAIIAVNPPCKLARRETPFHTLTTSIINQQLSQKAADAIERRLADLISAPFTAQGVAALSPKKLRAVGLSGSKAAYIHNLVEAEREGILSLPALRRLSDEEVIRRLTQIKGVGKWTAEMFLMFCLQRADIVSLGDAGLQRSARRHYGKRFTGDDIALLAKVSERWKPWRTVACWHLWRSLDGA